MVVYRGPSQLDQSPIVAIVTGIDRPSQNAKTGTMAQLWILPAQISPLAAIDSGADYSVCGDCKHRPMHGNSCYVSVGRAPQAVWKKYKRGGHRMMSPGAVASILRARQQSIRLGAWGDPAALPYHVLEELTDGVKHTGYTHQWQKLPMYRHLLMASVDSPAEQEIAERKGWRTFRVRTPDEPIGRWEIACPASAESGHRTTCADCRLCSGAHDSIKSIAIMVHGTGVRSFIALRQVAA